ncbi:GLPGLI family protein [Tenacibaculum skagerrakense]|uniref:GLPGLI family protein n=1 Tax=Tenacibaculum skagerrakense TaxID=186571 RepID=A0A4R2P165_9FLAO|nr:GLPGLI family protein [Tenacibaculum skagerrakense]TCP28380.1 GLPGLI family protein [Tenacibaculum skagerrakense]
MRVQLFLALVLLSLIVGAQDFQGKATYKTHRNMDIKVSTDQNAPNSAMQKKLHDQLKKMSQKTFTLNFNKSESTYTQNKELKPETQTGGVSIVMIGDGGGNDVLYKDVNKKIYRNKTEISGKNFLIEDKLQTADWEMTAETKKIGKFTCYKATRSREEDRVSFTMTDGDKEETKEKVTVTTEVWYTPEIPVSNGPGMFWGLPGLILEVHEGKLTIVCTELVLNPSDKVSIDKPTKGKKVSQEKFDKIMREKTEEMMERFKNNRKSKNKGESISIEIQG